MILYVIFHSLTIIAILFFFNKWLDDSTLIDICLYSLFLELIVACFNITFIFFSNYFFILNIGNILDINFFYKICILFFFDEISNIFFIILDFALILCFYFLIEYFEYDQNSTGIILLSSLFSHAALWFFSVYDLFFLFFFWELISIISFFLIQYWSYRLPSYKASIKVFFISQLGDLPLFIFIFFLINRFETTDLFEIQSQLVFLIFEYYYFYFFNICVSFSTLLSFFLIFSMLLKSAQFFFYPWLLDAMEAPVPISAQLHSSTLVIIGFYIFFRFQNLIILSEFILKILLVFGVLSVICSSILGFFQEDGKKLLACSTASQLGYVVVSLGLLYFEEALALLIFCCTNKAFSFIWFGILMDRHNGLSDLRILSGVSSLVWLEHVGVISAFLNFIILPGVFSWHVKTLFFKNQNSADSLLNKYCFDVLAITWFFTSLYLIYLYLYLYIKPSRLILRNNFFIGLGNFSTSLFYNYFNISILFTTLFNFFFKKKLVYVYFWNDNSTYFISWSFYYLLFFSFTILLFSEVIAIGFLFDLSWLSNFFFLYDVFFFNFFNL